jgi:hypothetical protein
MTGQCKQATRDPAIVEAPNNGILRIADKLHDGILRIAGQTAKSSLLDERDTDAFLVGARGIEPLAPSV